MRITMATCLAGPNGIARPGTVMDMPEKVAKEWIDKRFALPFDKDRDKKASVGLTSAPEKFDQ